jgi:hypothetical protein
MDRRSPQQKKLDDRAFPVRVHVLVPERGFENLLLDMHGCTTGWCACWPSASRPP